MPVQSVNGIRVSKTKTSQNISRCILVVDFHRVQTSYLRRTEGKMIATSKIASQQPMPYATRADFCQIFEKNMDRLYLLSFLLTGDQSMAEKCFVRGLDDSAKGNLVFKEWAQAWARRRIIQNAIQMIRPRPVGDKAASSSIGGASQAVTPAEMAAIVDLPVFQRFVFVMSVLERYSDQECSLLLNCARADVFAARTRALQQIGDAAECQRAMVSSISNEALPDRSKSAIRLEVISPLAVSA
jgi:DNA-directed RNA polymerase specialized sigma24 family protein